MSWRTSRHHDTTKMFSRLKEDIDTIMLRDPAARSRLEVLTCYPGLHAVLLHRLAHACWRAGWHWLGRWISHWSRFFTGIEIHPAATLGRRVFIDHGMGVVIGETAQIGDDCTIYQGVTLGGTSLYKGQKRHPTLGVGVVVSAGAKVLGGFEVGDGARVGSNAVVLKPVPPGATAVGIPARIILPDAPSVQQGAKQEFSAYGITPNADDPVSLALKSLIDNAALQHDRIEAVLAALDRLGEHLENTPNDPFDASELRKLMK
ncbi:Serine acetyltransferase [Cupriavidus taiwanensis]|uniref:serine O-acetyltransferase n=2 Tax=Cupriavidus TaxID=106589 RepID=A0A375IFB9_9BURK|nr:Serine acetyltransferase [Cupriavidus taiwanensis]